MINVNRGGDGLIPLLEERITYAIMEIIMSVRNADIGGGRNMNEEESTRLKHRSDEEITDGSDYYQTNDLINTIHGELLLTKEKIDDLLNNSGWDAAFFDVDIDLKVCFDKSTVRIRDKWRAIEP